MFGIELPKMVKEDIAINKKNGSTYWQDAIAKEIKNENRISDVSQW